MSVDKALSSRISGSERGFGFHAGDDGDGDGVRRARAWLRRVRRQIARNEGVLMTRVVERAIEDDVVSEAGTWVEGIERTSTDDTGDAVNSAVQQSNTPWAPVEVHELRLLDFPTDFGTISFFDDVAAGLRERMRGNSGGFIFESEAGDTVEADESDRVEGQMSLADLVRYNLANLESRRLLLVMDMRDYEETREREWFLSTMM